MQQSEVFKIRNVDVTKIDIDRIIYLTSNLIELLNNETEILTRMDLNSFSKIYEAKMELVDELEVHQKILSKKKDMIKDMDKEKIQKLKDLNLPFEEAKTKNREKLENAINVNRHVVSVVKKLVTEKIQAKSGYSSHGNYAATERMETEMPPFNLNSKI